MRLNVNGRDHEVDVVHDDTPLLWVLRDHLGMVGTKFGCGIGMCGACTMHIDGHATFSCSVRAADLQGRAITTIEGLAVADGTLHRVQQAWADQDVAQCGYCQSGQIMRATALLEKHPKPTRQEIDEAMAGSVCRCGTYNRIRLAIEDAAGINHEA